MIALVRCSQCKSRISHRLAESGGQARIVVMIVKLGMGGIERGAVYLREALAEIFAHQRVTIERARRVRVGG